MCVVLGCLLPSLVNPSLSLFMKFYICVANSKPSTKKLLQFVARIAVKWYEVGAALLEEEQEPQLKLIQTNHGSDVRKCCLNMLQYWMDTHPEATWHHLVTALRSPGVDLTTVASDIEKNFTGKNDMIIATI